ncbi:MAG: helix-turn-helix transcriptional regulator [Saprospiraceae bacterium]|nr:helix-turn-helix transcriptional regulator [Saprospiraceae bacterium]
MNFDLTFPSFNLYSMPLLILVLQGYLFAVLLLLRYRKKQKLRDLLLAILLIITGYHRTSFIVGFMDWYDTFRNTKINYYLINFLLGLGPLIYFYVKSAINPEFRFKKKDIWHFIPALIYFVYCLIIWIYDSQQPGYDEVQNGLWMESISIAYVFALHGYLSNLSMLLYIIFTFILYYQFKDKVNQYYSNTYRVELIWLRNFLYVFSFTFAFGLVAEYIDFNITELHWTQRWWTHFVSACALVYLGLYGYFTDLSGLENIDDLRIEIPIAVPVTAISEPRYATIIDQMENEQFYLDPDLTLGSLSQHMGIPAQELSSIINGSMGKNFNDFVNEYRVNEVKDKIKNGRATELSLLGVAFESGFNSKATFNRTFKKFTSMSPSEYMKSIT